MSQIVDYPGLTVGETAWEGFNEGDVIIQRDCPDCDRGLLLYPARFCSRCSGDGKLTRTIRASMHEGTADE